MIATILKLSRSDCKALELKDLYSLHKAVYSLFPARNGNDRDFLFADKGGDFNSRHIIILSRREPLKPAHGEIESKVVSENYLNFAHYGFEILINPTQRDAQTGKILAIRGKENLHEWFEQKVLRCGFEVLPNSLQISKIGVLTYQKGNSTRTHNAATFIGKLKVTKRKEFIRSFEQGIGRAKGFGFGLLQIVPIDLNN